jgi:hypothetical protein
MYVHHIHVQCSQTVSHCWKQLLHFHYVAYIAHSCFQMPSRAECFRITVELFLKSFHSFFLLTSSKCFRHYFHKLKFHCLHIRTCLEVFAECILNWSHCYLMSHKYCKQYLLLNNWLLVVLALIFQVFILVDVFSVLTNIIIAISTVYLPEDGSCSVLTKMLNVCPNRWQSSSLRT